MVVGVSLDGTGHALQLVCATWYERAQRGQQHVGQNNEFDEANDGIGDVANNELLLVSHFVSVGACRMDAVACS